MSESFRDKSLVLLNKILELELAGVVRYTHYSFMVFGHSRIPIVSWLRDQAQESLTHAIEAGEMVTHFGGHPSLGIGDLLESKNHDINAILVESLEHESRSLELYKELLDLSRDQSVLLEEYAMRMIAQEELHSGEVNKMLRKEGATAVYKK